MSTDPSSEPLLSPPPSDRVITTATPAGAATVPSRRRNGKQPSCEPCRLGKLRCDHARPTCSRCQKRNRPDKCVYHPAPLTKPRQTLGSNNNNNNTQLFNGAPSSDASKPSSPFPGAGAAAAAAAATRSHHDLPSPSSSSDLKQQSSFPAFRPLNGGAAGGGAGTFLPSSLSHSPVAPPMVPATAAPDKRTPSAASLTSPESAMSFRDNRTGFLGPTSYSAVYTENPTILETLDVSGDATALPAISPEKIQQGADVLSLLGDIPVYRNFTQRWDDTDGLIVPHPIFFIWINALWHEFGAVLEEGNMDHLRTLSKLVWDNTRTPKRIHGNMTAREWANASSGRNLRWEVVGVILSFVGLVAVNLSDWDNIFDSIRERYCDRATFAERMRKASEYTLCFCYESEVLNETYCCALYLDLILVESIKGDAHYAAWQRTGEMLDSIVAMGMHQGSRADAETPFFLAEFRKKIFISAYGHDKVISSFLGRPPRLSHRYCKMEMPLDLNDIQLCTPGVDLEFPSYLDNAGWNTVGHMNRTTWLRVWFQHSRVREDILEIALGSDTEDIEYRTEQVRRRIAHINHSFPSFMRVTPEEILCGSGGSELPAPFAGNGDKAFRSIDGIFILCIHCGILHTEFLLQRALINRRRSDPKQLIPVSRRLLKLVLLAHSHTALFRNAQGDLTYILAFHGLPVAGCLAVYLLNGEQIRQSYAPDLLPRSEIIQELSVFISALSNVRQGEGNFAVCDQGRRALKRVLDQILSPQTLPPPSATGGQPLQPTILDDASLYFPTSNDADFLNWLETVEWDKASWVQGDGPP